MKRQSPIDRFVEVRGLRLHVAEWGNGDAPAILCLHGYQDHARLFDALASRLADEFRVLAIDARGHGDSGHVGAGGAYHFPDYVADLHGLQGALLDGKPFFLLGHSLGGVIATYYAGTFPERVARLILLEAIGPPPQPGAMARERLREFAESIGRLADAPAKRYANVEEAAARVMEKHPGLRAEHALHYARYGTRAVDGGLVWKFDPRLHARNPYPWVDEAVRPVLAQVTMPTLIVQGSAGYRIEAATRTERLALLPRAEAVVVAGAGHHVHLDEPDAVAEHVRAFLRG